MSVVDAGMATPDRAGQEQDSIEIGHAALLGSPARVVRVALVVEAARVAEHPDEMVPAVWSDTVRSTRPTYRR